MKLILSFIISLLFVTTLSANCGKCDMKGMKDKCDTANCNMKEMKKENCKMPNCKMKQESSCGAGKCGSDMKKMKKENCKMKKMHKSNSCGSGKCGSGMKKMKKETKMCSCGMTQESCEKMMPKCEFRDKRKAQEAK